MRSLTEDEIGSIVLATMGGGMWRADQYDFGDRIVIDLAFVDKARQTVVRANVYDLRTNVDVEGLAAIVTVDALAHKLNRGNVEPLRSTMFNSVRIMEEVKK